MFKFIFISFILANAIFIKGQINPLSFDYSDTDSITIASSYNKKYKSISDLASDITSPFELEHEKFRAICIWITSNIHYVINYIEGSDIDVVNSKIATCGGYSTLLKSLCNEVGIVCEKVNGHAHGNPYSFNSLQEQLLHSWNIVTINGNKYFSDVTWASGYYDIHDGIFKHDLNPSYFLVNPEQFILDHFPENSNYQFLVNKFSKKEYELFPNVGDGLRLFEVTNVTSSKKIIETKVNKPIPFQFQTPIKIDLLEYTIITENEESLHPIMFDNEAGNYTFNIQIDTPGEHILLIEINEVQTLFYKIIVK